MERAWSLLENWIRAEPTASLWLAVVSALLFGLTLARSRNTDGQIRGANLEAALAKAVIFAGLLGASYFLLNGGFNSFNQIYGPFVMNGSLSNRAWQQWHEMYGGVYNQKDLQVRQYITVETIETIQPDQPFKPVLYRNVKVEQLVDQNSFAGFRENVNINMNGEHDQKDIFSGYTLSAVYEYDIVNPATSETRAEFRFPVSTETKLYEDVNVTTNGEAVPWRIIDGAIGWDDRFSAGQKKLITIRFNARGINGFIFEVPEAREILNFSLRVAVDNDYFSPYAEPANGGIQMDVKAMSTTNWLVDWKIERAILAPHLGLGFRQGWSYAPYQEMIVTLPQAARASAFFLCMAVLTLLICSVEVRLPALAVMSGLFMLPFLILMAGGVPLPGWIGPEQFAGYQVRLLPVITILPVALAFFVLREQPRLPSILILVLLALFAGGYALTGEMDEQKRKAVETFVQAAMIAYVFGLTLFVRLRRNGKASG